MYYTGHGKDTALQPEMISVSGILSLGVCEHIVAAELSEALPLANFRIEQISLLTNSI